MTEFQKMLDMVHQLSLSIREDLATDAATTNRKADPPPSEMPRMLALALALTVARLRKHLRNAETPATGLTTASAGSVVAAGAGRVLCVPVLHRYNFSTFVPVIFSRARIIATASGQAIFPLK
jgi:hypothetical protein